MRKPVRAWMLRLTSMMWLTLAAGCVSGTTAPSNWAACAGSRQARDDHSKVLEVSPDDRAVLTGANLLAILDAACAE